MSRDTVKTLAGLVIIGVIVVATFLYGNAQRQSQLKKQQQTADQSQQAQPSNSATPQAGTTTPQASGTPAPSQAAQNTSTPTPTTNTAPVTSPNANSLQGTGGSGQPAAAGQVAGAQSTPQAGASGGTKPPLPETGAPVAGLVGVTAIGVMMLAVRRSRQSIMKAARVRR
jgi:cytoskeletal protein RodZ